MKENYPHTPDITKELDLLQATIFKMKADDEKAAKDKLAIHE